MQHIDLMCRLEHPDRQVGPLRRIICWYFKDVPGVRQFRDAIHRAQTVDEMRELIDAFVPDEGMCVTTHGREDARA